MREQGKNPPDQTNKEEIGSQPEKEFIVMIVKIIQNLQNRMEKIKERVSVIFLLPVQSKVAYFINKSWIVGNLSLVL